MVARAPSISELIGVLAGVPTLCELATLVKSSWVHAIGRAGTGDTIFSLNADSAIWRCLHTMNCVVVEEVDAFGTPAPG
jgi:hypothetical protein